MEYRSVYSSPLGELTLVGDEERLTGLYFPTGRKAGRLENSKEAVAQAGELPVFQRTKGWLDLYFSGKEPDFMPPLALSGTPFRMDVWEILRTIPYGRTVTYGEIARRIAAKRGIAGMSAQAVGGAVGSNPIGILVPCHRVVGAGGSLTGFGGGLEAKRTLLALEGIDVSRYWPPGKG